MASELKNLSAFEGSDVPNAADMKFGIVWAEWNHSITHGLMKGSYDTLIKHGAKPENIISKTVPGAFELTLGGQYMAEYGNVDAIICIGCVIQGETRHFDFICQSVATGIMQLNLETKTPVIFGVVTAQTQQQAVDRSGGKHGNKGIEAAVTAILMATLKNRL